MCILIYRHIYLYIWYIQRYTLSIALYAMFSFKKQFEKLCIIWRFELMISCRTPGCTNRCTTSVDAEVCMCMVLVYLILHCGETVTLWLVSDILRWARRATTPCHDVAGQGLDLDRLDARFRRAASL